MYKFLNNFIIIINPQDTKNYHLREIQITVIRKRIIKELVNFLTIENSEAVFQYKNREGMYQLAKYFMGSKNFQVLEILNKEEKV